MIPRKHSVLLHIVSGWLSSQLEVARLQGDSSLQLEERESGGWWWQELGLA